MENKYQRGKIYKIVDIGYTKCYIGSTIETLSNRMSGHRSAYKSFSKGLNKLVSSGVLFEEFGLENCKIELIENYPCETKDELHRREGYYIQNTDCVNKLVAGRKKPEWIEANKEHLKTYKAQHHQKNKEKYNKKSSENYYNNKAHYLQIQKEYNEKNQEVVDARRKASHICDCGATYTYTHKTRHLKTLKHQNYIKSLEQD
jgi:hypothetical protein